MRVCGAVSLGSPICFVKKQGGMAMEPADSTRSPSTILKVLVIVQCSTKLKDRRKCTQVCNYNHDNLPILYRCNTTAMINVFPRGKSYTKTVTYICICKLCIDLLRYIAVCHHIARSGEVGCYLGSWAWLKVGLATRGSSRVRQAGIWISALHICNFGIHTLMQPNQRISQADSSMMTVLLTTVFG